MLRALITSLIHFGAHLFETQKNSFNLAQHLCRNKCCHVTIWEPAHFACALTVFSEAYLLRIQTSKSVVHRNRTVKYNAVLIASTTKLLPQQLNAFSHSHSISLTLILVRVSLFWVVAPCRLVRIYQSFRGLYLVSSYQTTRRYNPEDRHLHIHRHGNLKSHSF
jgi:hypothetical protein